MNYFEVFDLPQQLGIDIKSLEKKFHDLSRRYHPDYFTTASAEEKSRALRMTALLNDAYRTLRHPIRRMEYLLSIYQLKPDGSKVPQSLLMDVFEINERLQEIKASGNGRDGERDELRRQIQTKRDRFERERAQAARDWDELIARKAAQPDLKKQLERMAEILSESSYIRNLEDEIENREHH